MWHHSFDDWEEQGVGGGGSDSSETVEEKGLKLSIIEAGQEGKSNAFTSCKYVEERLQKARKNAM